MDDHLVRRSWTILCWGLAVAGAAGPAGLHARDCPQWGWDTGRNMVSQEAPLPDGFDPDAAGRDGSAFGKGTGAVKWWARLGTHTYGNPTVSGGRVFVGTNDASLKDDRLRATRGGMVLCFDEATGRPLWQLPIPKFVTDRKNFNFDHLNLGCCCPPTVQGDRAYLVTNRGEVLCLDVKGQADGNDGPYKDEGQFLAGWGKKPVALRPGDGDIVWRYDMITEVPSWPQDAANCSVLLHGDHLYVNTSNGVDKSHKRVPFPDAPTLIVLDRKTGRLVGRDDEKIGRRLFHGQWSAPSLGVVNGRTLVFLGGGDGVLYAFEALAPSAGRSRPEVLRKVFWCDCNPPEYRVRDGKPVRYNTKGLGRGGARRGIGPSEIIATPVFHQDRVYVAVGQDSRHGTGDGMLSCIDATRTGDVSGTGVLWSSKDVDRTMSTVSVAGGLVYVADYSGQLHCFDARTGRRHWVHDLGSALWSSTLVADGKVYIGTERDFCVFAAGSEKRLIRKVRLPHKMYNTPVAANGVLYVATQRYLYALTSAAAR